MCAHVWHACARTHCSRFELRIIALKISFQFALLSFIIIATAIIITAKDRYGFKECFPFRNEGVALASLQFAKASGAGCRKGEFFVIESDSESDNENLSKRESDDESDSENESDNDNEIENESDHESESDNESDSECHNESDKAKASARSITRTRSRTIMRTRAMAQRER